MLASYAMLDYIMKKIKLGKEDNPIPGGRYHNFKDFISFPKIGSGELSYKKLEPLKHPDLKNQTSIFKVIKKMDVLLTYPYQSYEHIVDFLREASIDPKVQSIKITLYRVAKNSNIVKALINAVKNGKQVTALIELQARFDEEANSGRRRKRNLWCSRIKSTFKNVFDFAKRKWENKSVCTYRNR